jgi:hypothetical protein
MMRTRIPTTGRAAICYPTSSSLPGRRGIGLIVAVVACVALFGWIALKG